MFPKLLVYRKSKRVLHTRLDLSILVLMLLVKCNVNNVLSDADDQFCDSLVMKMFLSSKNYDCSITEIIYS